MAIYLNGDGLAAALVRSEPFPFLVAKDMLAPDAAPALAAAFPKYRGAGFFPHADSDCGPAINTLVAELTAPAFADALGGRLGIERLSQHPTLATLCRALNQRHGTIHTDSRSKVVTALVYLSPDWPDIPAGCLRFLAKSDDIESALVPELRPVYGRLAAFKRTENSFHGHLPFEGERPVIQVAWLVDEAARERKTRRGRFSRALKWLVGRLDGWFGSGRGDNASHMD
jgi:hypothetical protein